MHIQEPFFWNYHKCYEGYPHNVSKPLNVYHLFEVCVWIYIDPPYTHTHTHTQIKPPSTLVLTYWAMQLAFYCSLVVSVFRDIRRKVEVMCIH